MNNLKQKVQKSFNLASNTYDNADNIQKKTANLLISFLKDTCPDFYPKTILDLGTGTGNVIEKLSKIFPNSTYTLNDIAENMLNLTTIKFHNIIKMQTQIGDFETINFNKHDLCISNFALQWVNNLEKTIKNLYLKSKVFAFTCLLEGTFSEFWYYINNKYCLDISSPIKYPTLQHLNDFLLYLPHKKYSYWVKNFPIRFKNIKEFLKYLKHLGANANTEASNITNLKKLLLDDNIFNTSYNVMFVVLNKE